MRKTQKMGKEIRGQGGWGGQRQCHPERSVAQSKDLLEADNSQRMWCIVT